MATVLRASVPAYRRAPALPSIPPLSLMHGGAGFAPWVAGVLGNPFDFGGRAARQRGRNRNERTAFELRLSAIARLRTRRDVPGGAAAAAPADADVRPHLRDFRHR